ncbi:MAG: hypothetical protein PVSMB4_19570 [Ktedonobacterales bacterium]
MNAVKAARKLVLANPESDGARALKRLVLSLEDGTSFNVAELYDLDLNTFELAIQILIEWRIDRFYAAKLKLFDWSMQTDELTA